MMGGMGACGAMGLVGAIVGGLLGLALLTLLVLGIVWLARQLRAPRPGGTPEALEVLRREYASGRLTREDYLQRHDDLTARSS